MHTIFFTINCVEQLTFSKTFVDQLQFEQLIFFCLKVKLLEIHVRQKIFHDFWFSSSWQKKWHLLKWCRANKKLCRADFSSKRISSRWSWPLRSHIEHAKNNFHNSAICLSGNKNVLKNRFMFLKQFFNHTIMSFNELK